MNDVRQGEEDDGQAAEQLLPLVYDELRKLAAQKMAQEKPGQTLQATALVHEVYIRLVDVGAIRHWNGRGHFFAAAAEAMRRILVEHARRKRATKRDGNCQQTAISELVQLERDVDIVALDDALSDLAERHPSKARLVRLRYFAGCTLDEAAEVLGVSRATSQRHWAYARAWLYRQLSNR